MRPQAKDDGKSLKEQIKAVMDTVPAATRARLNEAASKDRNVVMFVLLRVQQELVQFPGMTPNGRAIVDSVLDDRDRMHSVEQRKKEAEDD